MSEHVKMLEAFAERHGWWTADGKCVAGNDKVFYCTCKHTPTAKGTGLPFKPWHSEGYADMVFVHERHKCFSTPEAAEAHARREWEG